MKKIIALIAAITIVLVGFVGVAQAADDKVTICHATSSETNPFNQITVAKQSIVKGHSHDAHKDAGDIIPPFDVYPGRNWTDEGQAIWNADCNDTDGPDDETPVETRPYWQNNVRCPWSVPNGFRHESYTFNKSTTGRRVTLTFTAKGGYVFRAGDRWVLSNDGKTATVQEFIIIPRCRFTEPPRDNPKAPKPNSKVDKPKGTTGKVQETFCLMDSLVTKVYNANRKVISSSTVNGHPDCAPKKGVVFNEEGM